MRLFGVVSLPPLNLFLDSSSSSKSGIVTDCCAGSLRLCSEEQRHSTAVRWHNSLPTESSYGANRPCVYVPFTSKFVFYITYMDLVCRPEYAQDLCAFAFKARMRTGVLVPG